MQTNSVLFRVDAGGGYGFQNVIVNGDTLVLDIPNNVGQERYTYICMAGD